MNNILITGDRRKSIAGEVLTEILAILDCSIGGYWVDITRDSKNKNIRIFDLTSLYEEDKNNIFFRKDDSTGFSKLNIEVFNTKGVEILHKSFENRDLIILNEIGFLESKAEGFISEVKNLLDSSKVVIAALKDVSCPYIDSIKNREDIHIFKVNENNKDTVKRDVINLLRLWQVKLK
jgi:nucleoside-triphosphatase